MNINNYLVYCLYYEGQAVYVGLTDNLRRRVKEHKREKVFDEATVVQKNMTRWEAKELERLLIRDNAYPYNVVEKKKGAERKVKIFGLKGTYKQIGPEDYKGESPVMEKEADTFEHKGRPYGRMRCANNLSAWISKRNKNRQDLARMERESKREPHSPVLEGKVDRKKKTIENNMDSIVYWDNAANVLLAEKIKRRLI